MTWSRFDDAARKGPKATKAGNEAWGFWAASIMYCNQYSTDGFIPDEALKDVPPVSISKSKAKLLAERLVSARMEPGKPGLFERDDARGGYIVHDFLDWNPSKADVDQRRADDKARKQIERAAAKSNGGASHA